MADTRTLTLPFDQANPLGENGRPESGPVGTNPHVGATPATSTAVAETKSETGEKRNPYPPVCDSCRGSFEVAPGRRVSYRRADGRRLCERCGEAGK